MVTVIFKKSGCHAGQSIVEYVMIGGLIGAFCIIAMFVLGIDVQDLFGASDQGMIASEASSQTQPSGTPNGGSGSSGSSSPSGSPVVIPPSSNPPSSQPPIASGPSPFGNIPASQVCFTSGSCFSVPVVPGGPVDSSGAQGNQWANYFADVLSQIAAQINADPTADSALKTMITQLANQGHGLGNDMNVIQNTPSLAQATVSLPLTGTLTSSNYQTQISAFGGTLTQLNNYIAANPGAVNGGVSGLINLEAGQINTIAQGYFADFSTIVSGGKTIVWQGWHTPGSVQIVHQDANTICNSGGSGCVQPVTQGGG